MRQLPSRIAVCVLLSVSLSLSAGIGASPQAPPQTSLTSDALFQLTKVWTVHLTLSREAWDALTPVAPATVPPPAPPPPPPGPATAPNAQTPPALPDKLPPQFVAGFLAPEGKRNGISGQTGRDFEYVRAALDFEDRHFDDVAVRFKGNGTYNAVPKFGKPSFKIDLNKYVKGQKLAGVSTLNLHSNITDASWMNEVLAYRLYRDAGAPAPRTAYAKVYVTIPGSQVRKYLGLYSLVENVDTNFFADGRSSVPGGAIFKPVTRAPFTDLGKDWAAYNQTYDPKTDLTAAQKQRIIDFCDLVSNGSDQAFAARLSEFVDLDAFAKHMAVNVWLANPDGLLGQGQNYYVYLHPKAQTLAFVPWDQDHSFGQFVPFVPAEAQQQWDILHPWANPFQGAPPAMADKLTKQYGQQLAQLRRFLERTMALESFKRKYLPALAELTRTVAQPERLSRQVDELAAVIGPVVAEEPADARTPAFKESLGEATFKRPINQNVTVVPIKTFVRLRHASVVAQLRSQGVQ
jgi:hypothetical protein